MSCERRTPARLIARVSPAFSLSSAAASLGYQPDRPSVRLNSGSRTCSLPQPGQREGVFSLLRFRNPNPQALHSGWWMISRFFPLCAFADMFQIL